MRFIKKATNWVLLRANDLRTYISNLRDWFYSIEVKKFGTRSLAQNNFYWLCLWIVEKELWIEKDELHLFFKVKFMWEENWRPSTKEKNKEEMVEYMEKIIDYCAMQWILLPQSVQ